MRSYDGNTKTMATHNTQRHNHVVANPPHASNPQLMAMQSSLARSSSRVLDQM